MDERSKAAREISSSVRDLKPPKAIDTTFRFTVSFGVFADDCEPQVLERSALAGDMTQACAHI